MADLIAGMGTSHVPGVGAAMDNGKTDEAYWKPLFDGLKPLRAWHASNVPDVNIIVFNDHATSYSLDGYSTFTIGVGDHFKPADEGWGPRKVPNMKGHPELAWHIVEEVMAEDFDLAVAASLDLDHGFTVPLSIAYDQPDVWPTSVIPVCVNVIQHPLPTALRCFRLGQAIGRAVASFPQDMSVAIWGTGGLSHQLGGERVGVVNPEFDQMFMDNLTQDPMANTKLSHAEFIREAGCEGVEMIMWNVMRGALNTEVKEIYRFYHIPVSATAYGAIILENK
ncbi:class III extradiol dioxygenase subunit beta [Litorivicinus sp.]|jgi:protocatechuate 4,5-dioxygenase beta chain|nr:class III extradiol dioxygenase subunit beta [Litorivicinus sp.]MDC1208004.1 class III extradiol dioxygenase subunit beta [Litorivicinus sp.]MDC1240527.1 class III extradiol dioxygenase subunit beta [Litorivicinus sp.]MDC1466846.1 class III extradiol dioxygenase subunit beta [Litorivicinus sp.]|tara:strand:- start:2129 stop:2968 length:840 start_codon:yes stop_codon:yes gene_type:complete